MRMILLNMVFSSDSFGLCPLDAVHAYPEGVPSRPPPKARGLGSAEGDNSHVWGKESAPQRGANSGSRKGERASAGRWCSERGTLNADRRI